MKIISTKHFADKITKDIIFLMSNNIYVNSQENFRQKKGQYAGNKLTEFVCD